MTGVVLAIAFLAYMLITDDMLRSLVVQEVAELQALLQAADVDVRAGGERDEMMMLLIGLTLLTCTVGIVNSMLMSVTERVKEIGTLKCLGARDEFIVKIFFIESSLQGMLGSLIGVILGCAVACAVMIGQYKGHARTFFPVWAVTKSMLASFLCGSLMSVFAALLPAYLAAQKQPVEALRVEE